MGNMGALFQQSERHPGGSRILAAAFIGAVACLAATTAPATASKARPSVYEATLDEHDARTPEVSTDELRAMLAKGSAVVLDARTTEEYASAHIPGSLNLDEKQLGRFTQSFPDRASSIVLYSNGPFCERARLRSEDLLRLGYTRLSRYQLGLPVWRALGNTVATSLPGFRLLMRDSNTVIVDARSRVQYAAGTVPGALPVLAGEVSEAEKDRRLRYYDHGTRMIVFADNAREARAVAEEFSRNAYSNASYFSGTYEELKRARFFTERKPSPSNLDPLAR